MNNIEELKKNIFLDSEIKNEPITSTVEIKHSYEESAEVDDAMEYDLKGAYYNTAIPGETKITNVKKLELLKNFLLKNNFELYLNSIDFLGYDFEIAFYENPAFNDTKDVLEYFCNKKFKIYKIWKRRTNNNDNPEITYRIIYIVQLDADSEFFSEEHLELSEDNNWDSEYQNESDVSDDSQEENEFILPIEKNEEVENVQQSKNIVLNKKIIFFVLSLFLVFLFVLIYPICKKNVSKINSEDFLEVNYDPIFAKDVELPLQKELSKPLPVEFIEKYDLSIELKDKTIEFINANFEYKFSKIKITEYLPESDTMKSFHIYPRSSVISISGTLQD